MVTVGRSYEVPLEQCVNCGYKMNGAFAVGAEDAKPGPGDFTVCTHCGHLMVFGEGLKLREPTDEEIKEVAGDKNIVAATTALHALKQEIAHAPGKYRTEQPGSGSAQHDRQRPPAKDP